MVAREASVLAVWIKMNCKFGQRKGQLARNDCNDPSSESPTAMYKKMSEGLSNRWMGMMVEKAVNVDRATRDRRHSSTLRFGRSREGWKLIGRKNKIKNCI